MIHVERPPLSSFPSLADILESGRAQVAEFLAQPPATRAQRRAPTKVTGHPERAIGEALHIVFDSKCAFCETAINPRRWTFDRLWPESAYPERAFDWDNLFLCCSDCNLYKRDRFPLLHHGTTRAGADAPATPLLLDPTRDVPELSLRFLTDGSVVSLDDSGEATIRTFVLNRPDLQERRLLQALETQQACGRVLADKQPEDVSPAWLYDRVIASMPGLSHLAVVNAVASHYLIHKGSGSAEDIAPERRAPLSAAVQKIAASPRWLRSVEIENFKAIKKLKLDFAAPQQNRQPWLMLLGENGVGKSTILQAVALAMMGGQATQKPAHSWLRRGTRRGHIRLIWDDGSVDFVLRFSQGETLFVTEGTAPDVPVLAYGATRLLPDEPEVSVPKWRRRNVDNLFDPLKPLAPVQAYLCNRTAVSKDAFDRLAYNLIQLLDLDEQRDTIVRGRDELRARIGKRETSFAELSGGRKSVLALAMDIMFNLAGPDGEMRNADGLVLLDEIELHLHPRWKVKIVKLLRQIFPTVRFIATTHDPLCANDLEEGELQVLFEQPHTNDRKAQQINIPPGARTDDILTGPWFGLQSTMDDDTWQKMSDHSTLLQMLGRTDAETAAMQELEHELRRRLGSYGDTQAQRAALAINAMMHNVLSQHDSDQLSQARLRAVLNRKNEKDGDV